VSWAGRNFRALTSQIVQTTSNGGQPASATRMSVDTPGTGAIVIGSDVFVAGWALDTGSLQGTGVDAVHVWAWPTTGGAPTFVGAAAYGAARADVAGAFGQARFTNSGFNLVGTINTPGTYDLAVYPHSTVAQAFNAAQGVRVTVLGSKPFMCVDTPSAGATVSGSNITIGGWALDAGSTSSAGVDAIHIWAFPVAGGAPQFFGVASVGGARPDVAAAFGGAQFTLSGFNAVGTLTTPGDYDLAVFARSTLANTFNNVQVVRVHVQ
jgi:hypothetical protein